MEINPIQENIRTRFAPTPSGYLHIGNAFSFVLTWLFARSRQGEIFLRIDDLDRDRTRKAYVEDIFRSLNWLGLDWDTGPSGVDDFYQNYSQHQYLNEYQAFLDRLRSKNYLFACTCSRKMILEENPNKLYSGRCSKLNRSFDESNTAWRLHTPSTLPIIDFQELSGKEISSRLQEVMPHFVLRKKNGLPTYQVASVMDDVRKNINLIIRGDDLISSTIAQVYLSGLDSETESFQKTRFFHHPLLANNAGNKLSKSDEAPSLKARREKEKTPEHLYLYFSGLLGLQACNSAHKLLSQFDIEKLNI